MESWACEWALHKEAQSLPIHLDPFIVGSLLQDKIGHVIEDMVDSQSTSSRGSKVGHIKSRRFPAWDRQYSGDVWWVS